MRVEVALRIHCRPRGAPIGLLYARAHGASHCRLHVCGSSGSAGDGDVVRGCCCSKRRHRS